MGSGGAESHLATGISEAAKQYADDLAARFRKEAPARARELTLGTLFDIYERDVTPFTSGGKQGHDRRARRLFERCWGRETTVTALDRRDWDRFIRDRRSGRLKPAGGYHLGGVRDRQIEYDLRFVVAVCNWAVAVRESGQPLLAGNPFRGFPVPGEQNINQPITSDRDVAAMRAVADTVDHLCPLYLELTYWTGHRRMAVGRLRWSEFDLASGTVCWSAKHDKTGSSTSSRSMRQCWRSCAHTAARIRLSATRGCSLPRQMQANRSHAIS